MCFLGTEWLYDQVGQKPLSTSGANMDNCIHIKQRAWEVTIDTKEQSSAWLLCSIIFLVKLCLLKVSMFYLKETSWQQKHLYIINTTSILGTDFIFISILQSMNMKKLQNTLSSRKPFFSCSLGRNFSSGKRWARRSYPMKEMILGHLERWPWKSCPLP